MPFSTDIPRSPDARQLALRRRLPWALLALGLLVLVSALTLLSLFPRVDRLMQNTAANLRPTTPSPDIVIVAVDARSVRELGRWPWRRSVHAQLLQRITAGKPKCIGLDIFFNQPNADDPQGDAQLAAALRAARCSVLPMGFSSIDRGVAQQTEVLPAPIFARAATAIGHANMALDAAGSVRGFYRHEGFADRLWPHFALAMQQAAEGVTGAPGRAPDATRPVAVDYTQKRQRHALEVLLPQRPLPTHRTVSYIDVLQGTVAPDVFRNRLVLVGASTGTLVDRFFVNDLATQRSLVPGVEVFARALDGLMAGRHLSVASPAQNLAFNLIPLALALLGLLWLRPLGVIALVAALLFAREAALVAQPWLGLRLSPVAGHIGLLLVYPLWSLMRQTAALRFLQRGARDLNTVLSGLPIPDSTDFSGDYLDRQIAATAAAVQRVRNLHRFVRDGVDHLPDATLVLNRAGIVFSANLAAGKHWRTETNALVGQDAHTLLADVRARGNHLPMIVPGTLSAGDPAPIAGEGEDAQGRNVLLRCAPFLDAGNAYAGWMVAIVDITRMRRVQSQREEALRFISHDIREPSASILTVIELARAQPDLLTREVLLQRIERHARTGLELADGFVNLARAEAQPFRAEILDLVSLLDATADAAWAGALARGVRVRSELAPDEAPCLGDRSLLPRALSNVMSNALKYSPRGSTVTCRIVERDAHWALSIRDEGPGIPLELQSELFKPFHRLQREAHPEVQGVGLGLLLVRTIVQRHGGQVEIDSAENAGCAVTLVLPKPTPAILTALSKHARAQES